jgi:hypothetical protein
MRKVPVPGRSPERLFAGPLFGPVQLFYYYLNLARQSGPGHAGHHEAIERAGLEEMWDNLFFSMGW